jgi:hypothetical protein
MDEDQIHIDYLMIDIKTVFESIIPYLYDRSKKDLPEELNKFIKQISDDLQIPMKEIQ